MKGDPNAYRMPQQSGFMGRASRMPPQGPMAQQSFMQRASRMPPQGPMANRGANPAFAQQAAQQAAQMNAAQQMTPQGPFAQGIAQMTGPAQLQAMQRVRGAQGPMATMRGNVAAQRMPQMQQRMMLANALQRRRF